MENNGFEKFRKKALKEHVLWSIVVALCSGLVGAGISIMSFTLGKVKITFAIHIVLALVCAAIGFCLYFFLAKPTDRKIAARMDKDMAMKEKVQTMVEYKDQSGTIVDKQRTDANEKLNAKPAKAMPFRLASWSIPAFIIAAGLFSGSFFTTEIKDAVHNAIHPIDPDKVDEWTEDKINDIINDLDNNEYIDETLDEKLHDILEDLEQELQGDIDQDSRQDKIDAAKEKVDEAVDEANSKEEIGDALDKSEDDALKKLGEAIREGDEAKIDEALEDLKNELDGLSDEELIEKLKNIADEIEKALEESNIPEGDELRDALQELADELKSIAETLEQDNKENPTEKDENGRSENGNQAQEDAEESIDKAGKAIKDALEEQKANEEAGEQVKKEMDELADPENAEKQEGEGDGESGENGQDDQGDGQETDGENSNGTTEEGEGGDNEGSAGSSGTTDEETDSDGSAEGAAAGNGNTNYAGNDTVYTGKDGDTEYSEVIDEYHNDASKDAESTGDGDLVDAVDEYFKLLFGNEDEDTNP